MGDTKFRTTISTNLTTFVVDKTVYYYKYIWLIKVYAKSAVKYTREWTHFFDFASFPLLSLLTWQSIRVVLRNNRQLKIHDYDTLGCDCGVFSINYYFLLDSKDMREVIAF